MNYFLLIYSFSIVIVGLVILKQIDSTYAMMEKSFQNKGIPYSKGFCSVTTTFVLLFVILTPIVNTFSMLDIFFRFTKRLFGK